MLPNLYRLRHRRQAKHNGFFFLVRGFGSSSAIAVDPCRERCEGLPTPLATSPGLPELGLFWNEALA
jgi:hypothetical protein